MMTEQENKEQQNVVNLMREGYNQAAMTYMLEMIHAQRRVIKELQKNATTPLGAGAGEVSAWAHQRISDLIVRVETLEAENK